MYMLQQQSDAIASSAAARNENSSDDESENDNDFPDDNFADEEKADALQVSSVDSLFADDNVHEGKRSSGALIMAGKKLSKPDRISLRSVSEQEADDRLDNEYGLSPTKLPRDFSEGFRVPIAKIKTMFDSTKESDIRYHHLHPPPSLERNTSENLVDLELAPGQRRHAADVPSVNWDLSKTAWSQHIQQSAFDASSRPPNDWEAPSNEVVHERYGSKWGPVKYTKRQLCWWFWQILFAIAGAVVLIILLTKSKSS